MCAIKHIVVTGDIFRPDKNNRMGVQKENIEWLYQLIRPSMEMLTDLSVEPLYYMGGKNCLATRIYKAKGLDLSFESWVMLYDSLPSIRDLAMFYEYLSDALVIGFELPEFTIHALDTLNVPYIDFTIHPVRFMDDLIFGVRSNIDELSLALQEWVVTEAEIRIHAGLARATLARIPPVPQCKDVEGAALFCGQTMDDKVLIRNGRLIQVEDLLDQFSEMCNQHECVFIKPHPFSPENPVILTLTRLFSNTHLVNANFYHLLAHDNITHVYSITSSTSIEAAYFDKQGRHLSRYPYVFTDFTARGGAYLTVNSEIYSPKFWAQIIRLLDIPCSQFSQIDIKYAPSRMRRSLRSFWGADIFERI